MGYINKSYLQTQFSNFAARITAIFAKKADIPTKTSQLENDSGYKTTDNTLTNNLLATVPGTALDAVQGKVLDDKIEEVSASLTHIEKIYEFGKKDITEVTVKDLKQYKFIHIFSTDSNNVRSSCSITLPLAIFALGYTQDILFLGASTNYSNVIDTYSTVKYINDTTIQVYNRSTDYKTIVYGIK